MKRVMLLASREVCEVLSNELEQSFTVLPCTSLRKAEEMLLSKPDALVLNIFLPGMDGLTFLRSNAERLPLVAIVLTTFISSTLLEELADLNISYLIRIPYALENLAALLKKEPLLKTGEANIGCQKNTPVRVLRKPTPLKRLSEDQGLR